jgi:hypothetical protein
MLVTGKREGACVSGEQKESCKQLRNPTEPSLSTGVSKLRSFQRHQFSNADLEVLEECNILARSYYQASELKPSTWKSSA